MNLEVDPGYAYLLKFFLDYDYRRIDPVRRSYRRGDNVVGHQQRAFNIWWAIEQCGKSGRVGLEIGSAGVHTPWCLSTDAYATADHPVYGGACRPHMALRGEDRLPFEDGAFSLVLANHVVEHLPGDVVPTLRDWLRVLRPEGVLALVLPDQAFGDVLAMDKDHKHAWTAAQFRAEVVEPLLGASDVVEFDTFNNHFSFNCVLRKKAA